MKKLSKSINVFFVALVLLNQLNGQCLTNFALTPPPNLQNALYESKFGTDLSPSGTLRILFVMVEIDYDVNPNLDPNPNSTPGWPLHQLPVWANDLLDPNVPTGVAQGQMTRYYQQASSGNFNVIGDYLLAPTNGGLFKVDESTFSLYNYKHEAVCAHINTTMAGNFVTGHGLNNASFFDNWTVTQYGVQKITPSTDNPKLYDCVMFIWRNLPGYNGTGYSIGTSIKHNLMGFNSNSFIEIGTIDRMPIEVARHEFAHLLYGSNNFHAGGGGWGNDNYFIPQIGGWSNLGLANGSLLSWNAWDRDRMDWKSVGQQFNISARNQNNTLEVNADLDATIASQAGVYTLRDFVNTGDALRIKMPFHNSGTEFPEYLWIENHNGFTKSGNIFDKFQFESPNNACISVAPYGLYSYIQVDRDIKESTDFSKVYGGFADYIRPITANGFYDKTIETTPLFNGCIQGGNSYPFENNLQNPFTGGGDQEFYTTDINNDLVIDQSDQRNPFIEKDGANYNFNLFQLGHERQVFKYAGNKKINIGTNPSSASLMNLVSYDIPKPGQKNLRKIYLNGISIEIINQFTNGNIQAEIKFDKVDIENDVRWCADEIVLNQIPTVDGISLRLKQNKTIHLDQGLTATRMDMPITFNTKQIFASPTVLNILANANVYLESNSKIIVDNGSTLHLNSDSKIEMSSGAQIIVKNNSKLILDPTSWIKVNNGASIYIEQGSTIVYDQAVVQLVGVNSVLDIAGTLDIKANSNFQCMGMVQGLLCNGFVRLSYPTTISSNVIAGSNCTMNFINTTVGKKALEVTQECFFVPSNLVSITMQGCHAAMGVGSRISVPGANTIVNINNARMKSLNNIPKSQGGLWLYGQANINIANSQFDDGNYGIYDFQITNGHSLALQSCSFKNNNVGLYTWGEGVTLNDCNFYLNNIAWQAKLMSLPCVTNGGIVGGSLLNTNVLGYDFYSQGTATLQINDPQITYNTDGIKVEGTTAIIACGTVSNNSDNAISIVNNGNIDMKGNGTVHAQVTAVDNGFTISCDKGRGILLQNGYNDLRPLNSNTQSVINGVLRRKCPSANIIASNNHWDIGGNVLSSNDYNLVTAINNQGCLAATPITVVDNFPVSPALCGQAIPPCPFPPCNDLDAVQACPTCEHIDTQTFEWERLNTAALDALHLTTAAGGYDYLGAISLLNELLMYDESSINNKEQYVIDYSYDKMKESLGNAFKNNLIPLSNNTSSVNISVAKVIEVEDKFIANAIINDDYFERFFVSLDKVQTHRIAGNLDMALALLGDMSNWAETDEQSIVNSWICFLTIELGILNNTILIEDIEPSIYACSGSNPNRIIQQMSNEILYGYETVNSVCPKTPVKEIEGSSK